MNRIILARLELTVINGRVWVFDREVSAGWFVEIETLERAVDPARQGGWDGGE